MGCPGIPLFTLGGACLNGCEGHRAGAGVGAAKLRFPDQMRRHLTIKTIAQPDMA